MSNEDETNLLLCPKSSKVLIQRGWKNVYEIDSVKAIAALTVIFNANKNKEDNTLTNML